MPTNTGPAIAAYNLTGQVAIVTGGGRGLGQAFAQALATAGAAVAITARTESQLLETVRLIEGKGGDRHCLSVRCGRPACHATSGG